MMLYTLLEEFLSPHSILINYDQLLFLKTLKSFSIKTLSILLISEIILVALNGLTIQLLTKRLNSLTILQSFHVNYLGIIARKKKAI